MNADREYDRKVAIEYAKLPDADRVALQLGVFLGSLISAVIFTAFAAGLYYLVGWKPLAGHYHGNELDIWIWTALALWAYGLNGQARKTAKERYLRRHGKL